MPETDETAISRLSFGGWIWLTAKREYELCCDGRFEDQPIPVAATYLEQARRMMINTMDIAYQEMVSHRETDEPMALLFRDLANGFRGVPDVDLWTGRV